MKATTESTIQSLTNEIIKLNKVSDSLHKEYNKVTNYGMNWSADDTGIMERIYSIGDVKAAIQQAIDIISKINL